MTVGKWGLCNNDEGIFRGDWDTKEAAIAAAAGELGLSPGATFRVGRYVEYQLPQVYADHVIDQAVCEADDEVGESADLWLSHVPKEQEEKLTERLTKVFHDWIEEFGHQPEFLRVEDDEECTVPAAVS